MKRWDIMAGSWVERSPAGRFVVHDEAAAEIAALRERAEKAEARVAALEAECREWRYYCAREAKDCDPIQLAIAATGPLPAKEGTDA